MTSVTRNVDVLPLSACGRDGQSVTTKVPAVDIAPSIAFAAHGATEWLLAAVLTARISLSISVSGD